MKDIKLKSEKQVQWALAMGVVLGIVYLISFGVFRNNHHPSGGLLIFVYGSFALHTLFLYTSLMSMPANRRRFLLGLAFGLLHFALFTYVNYLFVYEVRTPEMLADQTWLKHLGILSGIEAVYSLTTLFKVSGLMDKLQARSNN